MEDERAENRVGSIVARAAAARFIVIVKSVLQPGGQKFRKAFIEASGHGVAGIFDSHRQPVGEVILGIIRLGKGISGLKIGVLAEEEGGAGDNAVNVSA